MVLIYFSGVDTLGNYRECSFGDQHIEGCFELLSALVDAGWQLIRVEMLGGSGTNLHLPAEAFDGTSMLEPLKQLQQEWEEILFDNSN